MTNNAIVVRLDFHTDLRQIVELILTKNAIAVDPAEPHGAVLYRYFANARRRLIPKRYTVVESMELSCPPELTPAYVQLRTELEQGIDVTARLSRKTTKATYEDQLLNDWGIIHFHLGLRDAQGLVPGTKVVLFAFVRSDVVHCIGFFDHKSWSKIEVLKILQRNWPKAIEHAQVKGITPYEWTDEDRARFRAAGGNILNAVNGKVFASIGGGYTAAGTSMQAHWQADHAMLLVDHYEKFVRENIATIVCDFEAAGHIVGTPPTFHLGFHADGRAIATEATANAGFVLGSFPV